jgi:hypothetical protein
VELDDEEAAQTLLDRRSSTLLSALLLATLALPVVWIVLTRDDHNIGDVALIELRIRDVVSTHPPLTGAYSRYGWAHPGPLLFYLFAVPYRLLGNDATALRATTLAFNLVSLGGLLWLARRRGRAPFVAIGVAATLLVRGLQPDALSYGWNVTVTLVPVMLTAVACWSVVCRDDRALIVATVGGLFVFQTHVGAGVVIAPLLVATWAYVGWRRLRPRVDRLSVVFGGALLALALLPVLVDLGRDPPGNIGRLVRWSVTNDEPKVGVEDGLRMIGRTSSLSFLWHPELPGRFLLQIDDIDVGVLPGLALLLLVIALVHAVRSGWHDEAALCAVVLVLWASGVVAASTITLPLGWWLVEWLQPLGWLTWAAIALVGWRVVQSASDRRDSLATAAVLTVAGIVVVSAAVAHARDVFRLDDRAASVVEPVSELTAASLQAVGSDPARIDFLGSPLTAETMMSGIANRMDAEGADICVGGELAYKFGDSRVCSVERSKRLIVRAEAIAEPPPAGAVSLAIFDPLSESERAEADALRAEIAAVLDRVGRPGQIGVLDTPLADTVLLGDVPGELLAVADSVRRLDELREVAAVRYGLYLVAE